MRRAAAGERGPLWIKADRQSTGRGRAGRGWISPSGNLAATLLLAPGCQPAELHQLSLLTGVAVHDAVLHFCNRSSVTTIDALRLKWPNDVLLGGAKVGGILIESTMAEGARVAAIGIGVNIAVAPAIEGRETAALIDVGLAPTAAQLLGALDVALRRWLGTWRCGSGFAAVRTAWLQRAGPIGEAISVNTGPRTISGAFAGIDETGALLVSSVPAHPGEIQRFTFGDVSLLPPSHVEGS